MPTLAMAIQYGADYPDLVALLARDLGREAFDYRPMELSIAAGFQKRSRWFGGWFQASHEDPSKRSARTLHDTFESALRGGEILIVGWSSVLAIPASHAVTRILLHAPRVVRLARLAGQREGGSIHDVESTFIRVEHQLSTYLHDQHGPDWTSPHRFDMTINVERFAPRVWSDLIQSCLKASALQPAPSADPGSREVENVVVAASSNHAARRGRTYAMLGQQRVALTGLASHEAAIAAIEQHLHHECHRRHN